MENKKSARQKIKQKKDEIKQEIKYEFKLNAPNIITLSRIVLGFILIYMLFSGFSRLSIAILFGVAAITDALDGIVARRFKQTTALGARLDQVIDRVFYAMVIVALVIWALTREPMNGHFVLMLFILSSREIVGMVGIAIRTLMGKDLYEVRYIGKITCWFQGFALAFLIAGFWFADYSVFVAGVIGLASGFDYLTRSFVK